MQIEKQKKVRMDGSFHTITCNAEVINPRLNERVVAAFRSYTSASLSLIAQRPVEAVRWAKAAGQVLTGTDLARRSQL